MADSKSEYSGESTRYIKDDVPKNPDDFRRYYQALNRKSNFKANWLKHAVNLNDVIIQYLGTNRAKINIRTEGGIKLVFENSKYEIKCDKVGGYLRVWDIKNKHYYTETGKASNKNDETHLYIKKRKEM